MPVRYFRWVFLAIIAGLLTVMSVQPGKYAIGLSQTISQDKYLISGGSAPWALGFSALILFAYTLLMLAPEAECAEGTCTWWRRFGAFCADFLLAIMAIAPIIGLIPLYVEWKRTREFAWTFERTEPAVGDGLLSLISFVLAILTMALYFTLPLIRAKPTPGSCIMGYQIASENGLPIKTMTALKRVLLGLTFLFDRGIAVPRLDRSCGTHAVKLK